jgi:hypothetical protein
MKKYKQCDRCGHKNRFYRKDGQFRVNIRNSFEEEDEARDALRYIKIPVESRGDIPYLGGTWKGEEWGEEFKIFKPKT